MLWLVLLALLSFLMVSTWRYWSFKDLNLLRPRSPLILIAMGGIIYGIWNWSQPVLLILASIYVGSGIAIRLGGIVRRRFPRSPNAESGDADWLKRSHLSVVKRCWAGKLREVLGETALGQHVRLVAAAEEESGTLTEIGGSAAFLAKLEPDAVEDAEALILAGTLESSKLALEANPQGLVIDLTYAAEDNPDARIRAPQVEGAGLRDRSHRAPDRRSSRRPLRSPWSCNVSTRTYPIARADRSHLRAGQRTRHRGHRRAAAADRESAFVSAGAEEGLRRAAGLRDAAAAGF